MGWFDELEKEIKKAEEEDKKKQTKKEVKDAEIIEKPAKQEVKKQPKEEAKPKKTAAKKESKPADKKETDKTVKAKTEKKSSAKKEETFQYPFSLYTEGHIVDISNYGFEDNKEYSAKEICDIMLKHRHYEFASEITFKMYEDDNTLVATSKQYKKG